MTDEGLLRNDFNEFNSCYHIDIEKVESLLDKEVLDYNEDLKEAERQAEELVFKMTRFFQKD